MRDSSTGNFVLIDKTIKTLFSRIRGREYSEVEAIMSFSIDVNCGKKWSISGYSKQWGWTRNRVRKLTNNLLSLSGHYPDRRQTGSRHPIHLISDKNSTYSDRFQTDSRRVPDATIKTKTKTKKTTLLIYPERFDFFWEDYPRKVAKANALKAWEKNDCGNGLYEEVMAGLKRQLPFWKEKEKKFIPYPATWINGHRWNDEVDDITKVELWR